MGAVSCLAAGSLMLLASGLPTLNTAADRLAIAGAFPGSQVPDTTILLSTDEQLILSELRGSVVILNFWATWCVPCAIEMPELQQLHEHYAASGLRIIAINQGEARKAVLDWVEQLQLDYAIGLDPALDVGRRLGVSGLPTTFIIDSQGIMRQVFYGPVSQTVLIESFTPYIDDPGT